MEQILMMRERFGGRRRFTLARAPHVIPDGRSIYEQRTQTDRSTGGGQANHRAEKLQGRRDPTYRTQAGHREHRRSWDSGSTRNHGAGRLVHSTTPTKEQAAPIRSAKAYESMLPTPSGQG